MYRAASMWTNAYAPELSMGMRTVEEQQDIYTEYEDVTEQVEREKAENANRKLISLDLPTSGNDGGEKTIVDTETGEIKRESDTPNETPTKAAKEAENENIAPNPGF